MSSEHLEHSGYSNEVERVYSARGFRFSVVVGNEYLKYERQIEARTEEELRAKAEKQLASWSATENSEKAIKVQDEYRSILRQGLKKARKLDWKSLSQVQPFTEEFHYKPPAGLGKAKRPSYEKVAESVGVPPTRALREWLSPSTKVKRLQLEAEAREVYLGLEKSFDQQEKEDRKRLKEDKAEALATYNQKKRLHEERQEKASEEVAQWKRDYKAGNRDAIKRYLGQVLGRSTYPDGYTKDFEIDYDDNSGIVVIDCQLPNSDQVPKLIEYRHIASRNEIRSIEMKKRDSESYYDDVLYQICLRNMYEVFRSDYAGPIRAVVFNGWVRTIERATGKDLTSCILTCQASRDQIMSLDLSRAIPKDCFRSLKGMAAASLCQIAPVRPIMSLNRTDSRFIEAREVLSTLDASTNLAEMEWEDFEHLVRELFEKMFSKNGGEVKVTQSSRDRGVDAIAFLPDPIAGGKFVIQAKRYNNVVPVSAVRDLYGTVINEGANKGILVTTSYYGADSREFAKDKPLELIDGSNLVYQFREHGYQVRVELKP